MFKVNIHNFRSFQNQSFDFSKVNILIGENSGGKSSLLKLLLALKQTMDSPTESNLKLLGDFTDLGNFEEVIYQKNKKLRIKLGFESDERYHDFFLEHVKEAEKHINKKESAKVKSWSKLFKKSSTSVNVEISNKLDDHTTLKTVFQNSIIGKVELVHKKPREENPNKLYCDVVYDFGDLKGVFQDCPAGKEGFFTLLEYELKDLAIKRYGEDFFDVFYKIVYLLVFQNYVEDNILKIRFVNPIGTSLKRFYFREDKRSTYSQIDLERVLNVLSDPTLSEKQSTEWLELLNKTIKDFGIAEELDIIKDNRLPVLALNVKTKDFWSNITDVGYGVSLQIPILFQAILSEHYTRYGQALLIEQPEVHLHPKLQARFIDTLLGIGPKNVYFIETHSEHIVRKLQVMIKQKKYDLKPEDVSIHYFRRDTDKFNITEHKILQDGKLSPNFPEGFFDTSYNLVRELL
ncbi:DUF3696 domain-containing protein [Flavobacterium sp. DG1-102-2]|uniref:DUF3696 domain-containing protein n=1 Tax=Flavobacterium sp. DG1-102-2 TaxID=3081663 RepID=UPI0029499A12|nr:DUF3696 domain-containing protein [Flavobacterium sp. DG1-102-2]MDV6170011.1 DUF3696 domain-containing protein [Flavobacterium sp. DG1-102-2]